MKLARLAQYKELGYVPEVFTCYDGSIISEESFKRHLSKAGVAEEVQAFIDRQKDARKRGSKTLTQTLTEGKAQAAAPAPAAKPARPRDEHGRFLPSTPPAQTVTSTVTAAPAATTDDTPGEWVIIGGKAYPRG